jgi:hypothetical protein
LSEQEFLLSYSKERQNMATATMADEAEIANAIGVLRHAGLNDDLLDKIELDRRLKISEEQDKMGLYEPTEKVVGEILSELANGRYARNCACKKT